MQSVHRIRSRIISSDRLFIIYLFVLIAPSSTRQILSSPAPHTMQLSCTYIYFAYELYGFYGYSGIEIGIRMDG